MRPRGIGWPRRPMAGDGEGAKKRKAPGGGDGDAPCVRPSADELRRMAKEAGGAANDTPPLTRCGRREVANRWVSFSFGAWHSPRQHRLTCAVSLAAPHPLPHRAPCTRPRFRAGLPPATLLPGLGGLRRGPGRPREGPRRAASGGREALLALRRPAPQGAGARAGRGRRAYRTRTLAGSTSLGP